MELLKIGGLQVSDELEQTPFDQSITASDLYLDRHSFKGRNGYRSALASGVGSAGDTPQGLWRHRGSPTSVRMLSALGGKVYISNSGFPQPTSETASDMTVANLGTVFATSAALSGAQLHKHFYIGTNEADVAVQRVKFTGTDTYAIESLQSIRQPPLPLATKGALSWFAYRAQVTGGGATTTPTGCVVSTTATGLLSTWYAVVGTTGDATQPADGASLLVTMTTAVDVRAADWLAVAVSPPDDGSSFKSIQIEISHDNATYATVGTITDRNPVPGSPNLIFCDLTAVSDTIKTAFKYIRFTVKQNGGASTLRYAVYGHLILYGRANIQPIQYFVTAFNPSTLQESPLSPEAKLSTGEKVTITDNDVKGTALTYPDQYVNSDAFTSSAALLSPFDPSNNRVFNKYAGLASPSLSDIGVPITISGLMPSGYSGNLDARVWKETSDGLRLVGVDTANAASSAYSVIDSGGRSILYSILYVATGTAPQMTSMCAKDGRLISVYENEVSVSSFVPLDTATTNPVPQWPITAREDADGWKFTIDGGGSREQGQCCITGDRVYILTNQRVMYLSGTQPNAPYYECSSNGVVSRQGAIWVNGSLYWASAKGIFQYRPTRFIQVSAEQNVSELTLPISDYYWRSFAPDQTTVLTYQQGSLYCWTGRRYLRFNFNTQRWTTGTTADTPLYACKWYDVGSTNQLGEQMWLFLSNGSTHSRYIVRWQPEYTVGVTNAASSDAGTAIPDWYYSTGFYVLPGNAIPKWLYTLTTGVVMCHCERSSTDMEEFSTRGMTNGDNEVAFPPLPRSHALRLRFQGANTVVVKRIMWETEPVEARGGKSSGSRF